MLAKFILAVNLVADAGLFIVIALVHPYLHLPAGVLTALRSVDIVILAGAMAALGLDTTFAKLRLAGRDALLLGALLFAYLVVGGGLANWLLQRAFGFLPAS